MKKELDAKTIEAEMRKKQESLRRAQDQIRSLNAKLTTAKKREKDRRYRKIGSTIEAVLNVGELSEDDLTELVACLQMPLQTDGGPKIATAIRIAQSIKNRRAKVSTGESPVPNGPASADQNREAVPGGRQGFTRPGDGSPLPTPTPAKP